jgi:hypothetical protein
VKSFAGQKLATLVEFQDINNVNCFLACDDPFERLSYDLNDLLELKKQMCVKLNTNLFVVLPGIKSKMMLLKNALTKKRNDLKKETPKIPSNIMKNNLSSNSSATDYSSNSTHSSAQQLVNNSSSSATSSNFEENLTLVDDLAIDLSRFLISLVTSQDSFAIPSTQDSCLKTQIWTFWQD